jgi:hypothetical protein
VLLPAAAIATILYANRNVVLMKDPAVRAAELQAYLVAACSGQDLPNCEDVKGSPQQLARDRAAQEAARATTAPARGGAPVLPPASGNAAAPNGAPSQASSITSTAGHTAPSAAPASEKPSAAETPAPAPEPPLVITPPFRPGLPRSGVTGLTLTRPSQSAPSQVTAPAPIRPGHDPSVALALEGPLMNARGFQDRFAIIGVAWKDYSRSAASMLAGIGLGTFLETSEDDFGVRLIIHNTYAWFLMELGPLGLAAFLWLIGLTARNLWQVWRGGGILSQLSAGTFAAFAGMLVFFMFNEGFYQRHYWLLFVLADRLRMVAAASARPVSAAASIA